MPVGTNFSKGLSVFGIPVFGGMGGLIPTGNVFFVDSSGSNPADNSANGTYAKPFNTINYAFTQCKDNNDDWIVCGAGHVETVSVASTSTYAVGGLSMNKIGVSVFCLGNGSQRSTVTFTATTATMLVSAVNIKLYNPRFLTGIDAVAAPINVQAADFNMFGAEYYDAPAMATLVQVLTTAAANRMVIDGYRFIASTTGTQKTAAIKIVGGDRITIRNFDIVGDFTNAGIYNLTTASTNLVLDTGQVTNSSATPQPAIATVAATSGVGRNLMAIVASGAQFTATNQMAWPLSYGSVIGTGGITQLTVAN
jgi:hypothetical protein